MTMAHFLCRLFKIAAVIVSGMAFVWLMNVSALNNCFAEAQPVQAPAKTNNKESGGIEAARIWIGGSQYLTLGVLVTAVASLIATGYALVKYFEINPLREAREDLRSQLTLVEAKLQASSTSLDELSKRHQAVLRGGTTPVLITPADGGTVIGSNVSFEWEYSEHERVNGYVLELRALEENLKANPKLFRVARPEIKGLHFQLSEPRGDYIWRVRPGLLQEGTVLAEGPWSSFGSFSVYGSVRQRIKETGKLRLATVRSSYDAFVRDDGSGRYLGFDIELGEWLVEKLSERLATERPIVEELVDMPWDRIFGALQGGEVDVALRSITRSKKREDQYSNVRFTRGYATNHQILIQRRTGGKFPEDLKKNVVGVKKGSINETAARYLVGTFEFVVDGSFVNYGDLYKALRTGQIKFAMVDSLLAIAVTGTEFSQFGPELDGYLESFYTSELGYTGEEYALAVFDPPLGEGVLSTFNEILSEQETAAYLERLREKYRM